LDEHTRSLRDVISVVREIFRCDKHRRAVLVAATAAAAPEGTEHASRGSSSGNSSGNSSNSNSSSQPDLYKEEMEYPAIREAVIAHEQVLLRVTGFDTRIDLPHKYLLNMARCDRRGTD
jgi:hypothetical protein